MSHPIACAAALAVQDVIRDEGLLEAGGADGGFAGGALAGAVREPSHVGDIRGRGLFWGLEFVADRASKRAFEPARQFNLRVKEAALARGLACYPGSGSVDGVAGDHVLLAPPYIVSADEIELIVDRLGRRWRRRC